MCVKENRVCTGFLVQNSQTLKAILPDQVAVQLVTQFDFYDTPIKTMARGGFKKSKFCPFLSTRIIWPPSCCCCGGVCVCMRTCLCVYMRVCSFF